MEILSVEWNEHVNKKAVLASALLAGETNIHWEAEDTSFSVQEWICDWGSESDILPYFMEVMFFFEFC